MEIKKYNSPLGGDISLNKATKGRGWKGLKGQMALALAVSLWIAGGVVSAEEPVSVHVDANDNDTLVMTDSDHNPATPPAGATVTNSGKTLTITGGTWNDAVSFVGAFRENGPDIDTKGYTLTLSGVTLAQKIAGVIAAASSSEAGDVSHNHLILDNVTAKGGMWAFSGGQTHNNSQKTGNADYNTVSIKNSDLWGGVSGGGSGKVNGAACHNEIYIEDSTVQAFAMVNESLGIVGGIASNQDSGAATDNTVTLKNAVIGGSVWGGVQTKTTGDFADAVKGNTLNLSGANTVGEFDYQMILNWGKETGQIPPTINTVEDLKAFFQGMEEWEEFFKPYVDGRVQNFETINITEAKWGTPVLTFTGANGIMQNQDGTWATIDASKLKFENLETIPNGKAMNLIDGPVGDVNLAATTMAKQEYIVAPVTGVLVDASFQGQLSIPDDKKALVCTASNFGKKLTFTDVEWKDSGALINHATTLSNVKFDGADVDTSNINFTNLKALEANKKMTLVSSFGDSVGTITGAKYKVGSALEGEGKASLVGSDLIFTAETGVGMTAQEQTHNTVMGATASMAALSAGNDFVGAATEGLAMAGNTGTDGMATYANMGGGSMNVETGSHVKTHTWNAILAIGHKNEKKLSTTEYGAFFEYGTGNYSTFNGDERGDGSTHYTGGGILGKWQKNNGFYVEGSLRAGSIHDDANNVLRDANKNPYSYTTDATYWGAHIGVGREIKLNKTDLLDLYAKYFYNNRGSVSFDAGGHYDLDAVESSVLRVGTRYTVKQNDNFKYYGGLAVEHEFAGRASGTATPVGGTPLSIRGADISGTSVRGEIGATFRPGEKSNVTLDLNLSGFAGKKQGLTGGLSAVFHI